MALSFICPRQFQWCYYSRDIGISFFTHLIMLMLFSPAGHCAIYSTYGYDLDCKKGAIYVVDWLSTDVPDEWFCCSITRPSGIFVSVQNLFCIQAGIDEYKVIHITILYMFKLQLCQILHFILGGAFFLYLSKSVW